MSGAEAAIITGTTKAVAGVLFSQSTLDFFFKWKIDTALLDELKIQVRSVEKLFWDAEAKLIEKNDNVNDWLKEARFAIYDTEDLLEKISIDVHEVNNRLLNTPIVTKSVFEKFLYKGSSFVDKLAQKGKDIVRIIHPNKKLRETRMSKMIEKLKHLASQKGDLGLQDKNELVQFQSTRISTSDDTDKSKIIGRDNDVDKILKLLNVSYKLRVITIIGMGGVGKTTLASMVYRRYETACPANSKDFEVIAWVCVSDSFDFEHVIKSILELITENDKPRPGSTGSDKPRPELLRQELSRALDNKKFLIVLDDVWDNFLKNWETLMNIFSVGEPGSRIIVTTREENVATFVSDSCGIYTLYELSDDECWSLFQSHAFRNGDSISKYPRLETIGKKIVAKCSGSPLAVKMVGRALGMKGYDENQWNFVLNSKIWDSTSDILPSLWLSYYHLPVEIKRCFAYFSIFPKDEVFSMEKMILLWIAEGFVRIPDGTSTCSDYYESKARTYFKHLHSAFFIQPTSSGMEGFVMHDLVHDLAQHVSEDVLVNLNNPKPKSRRLYYIQWKDETLLNTELLQKVTGMRTFLSLKCEFSYYYEPPPFDKRMFDGLLSKFKLLRVLSLEGYHLSELPEAIGDMKLLKYLNLAGTKVEYLPDWICRLYSLQTLNISGCRSLESLPAKLCNLVNLRHLIVTRAIQMPDGFGRMTNLQTLSNYKISECRSKQMREFKDLCNIRGSLEISNLNHVDDPEDVITGNFKNKKYLESYTLSWGGNSDRDMHLDESVLDALQPHMNLKELRINKFGGKRLSNWIVGGSPDFTMIESFGIKYCFNCKTLPSLGNMPHLVHLSISRLDSLETLDADFFGNSETAFRALETLKISYMISLEKWYIPESSRGFCSLTSLRISECSRLTEIPYCFPSLMQLEISACDDLVQFKMWEAATSSTTVGHSLQSIDIYDCPMLKEIPKNFVNLVEVAISSCDSLVSLPRLRNVQKLSVRNLSSLKAVEAALLNGASEKLNIGSPPGKVNVDSLSPSLDLGVVSFSQRNAGDEPVLISLLAYNRLEIPILGNDELDYFKKIPFKHIPFRLNFNNLTSLAFRNCDSFEDLVLPSAIKDISIAGSDTLTTIPDQFIADCKILQRFTISSCSSLKHLPSILSTSSISYFCLEDLPALKALPEGFHSNTTLQVFWMCKCPNLVFPRDGLPVKLERLNVFDSIFIMRPVPVPVPGNTYGRSLSELKLSKLTSLTQLILGQFDGTFEEDNCLPKSIKHLHISNFPDLKSLSGVVSSLAHLTRLFVMSCPLVTEKHWQEVLKVIPKQCRAYMDME